MNVSSWTYVSQEAISLLDTLLRFFKFPLGVFMVGVCRVLMLFWSIF